MGITNNIFTIITIYVLVAIASSFALECPDHSDFPPCPEIKFLCSGFKPHLRIAYHELNDGTKCDICPICVDSLEFCPIVALARRRNLFKRLRILGPDCNPVFYNMYVDIAMERCFAGELFQCRGEEGQERPAGPQET